MRLEGIKSAIEKIPFVSKINNIEEIDYSIQGNIDILIEGLASPLSFDFHILESYPLKNFDNESIIFFNKDLLCYKHVMGNGSICIHSSHSIKLEEKINIDFNALKDWIIKYYINKEEDSHYEHILVKGDNINKRIFNFMFTDTIQSFKKDEYGVVSLSYLNFSLCNNNEYIIESFYIKSFSPLKEKILKNCSWSIAYMNTKTSLEGCYYFMEEAPALYNKFAFSSWKDLKFSLEFLNILYLIEQDYLYQKKEGQLFPLFIGYRINDDKIHWQATLLEIGKFPIEGRAEILNGRKTGIWLTTLDDSKIKWGVTYNCSYEYFFGRGKFCDSLTQKKILIIGIGAVGSMVAKTLAQCGCTYIHIGDYDVKHPENVCRSEYKFSNGIDNKTNELAKILNEISPFINIGIYNFKEMNIFIKSFFSDKKYQADIKRELEQYDLIIDCSTDNDLMYVLNSLPLDIEVINMSITNHARELVCAFYPNMYKFVNNQFSSILNNNVEDLYNPIGCWSPTFKASYNDIAVLVQLALKHINRIYNGEKYKNNFVVQEIEDNYKIIEH